MDGTWDTRSPGKGSADTAPFVHSTALGFLFLPSSNIAGLAIRYFTHLSVRVNGKIFESEIIKHLLFGDAVMSRVCFHSLRHTRGTPI